MEILLLMSVLWYFMNQKVAAVFRAFRFTFHEN